MNREIKIVIVCIIAIIGVIFAVTSLKDANERKVKKARVAEIKKQMEENKPEVENTQDEQQFYQVVNENNETVYINEDGKEVNYNTIISEKLSGYEEKVVTEMPGIPLIDNEDEEDRKEEFVYEVNKEMVEKAELQDESIKDLIKREDLEKINN